MFAGSLTLLLAFAPGQIGSNNQADQFGRIIQASLVKMLFGWDEADDLDARQENAPDQLQGRINTGSAQSVNCFHEQDAARLDFALFNQGEKPAKCSCFTFLPRKEDTPKS